MLPPIVDAAGLREGDATLQWRDCAARHGDAFTLRFPDADWVFFSAPEAIRELLGADPALLGSGVEREVFERVLGRHSLLFLDGAPHARLRKAALPAFLPERMAAHTPVILEVTLRALSRLPPGAPFPAGPLLDGIFIEALLRCALGARDGSPLLALAPPLFANFADDLFSGRLNPRVDALDAALATELAARRARPAPTGGGGGDVIDALLAARDPDGRALGDDEVRDTIYAVLIAGQQTTGSALGAALDQLLGNEAVRARVETGLAAGRTDLLDAAILEALRLATVVPFVARVARAPVVIGGYELPAGATAVACIYLAHRRPERFPEPDTFRPERFLEAGARPGPFEFLPFGVGARKCLGMSLALQLMQVVLGALLTRVRLRAAGAGMLVVDGVRG